MLRKTMIALLAATSVTMLAPNVALAMGGGSGAGSGGAGSVGAINANNSYDDSSYGHGGCYIVQRRVHTRAGWRVHRVQICG
jgi:hypothetical protein